MKFGGNAEACFMALTAAGTLGSEMNTVWIDVMICFLFVWLILLDFTSVRVFLRLDVDGLVRNAVLNPANDA